MDPKPDPEDARRLLFALCGDDFISLRREEGEEPEQVESETELAEEAAEVHEEESIDGAEASELSEEPARKAKRSPTNASRQVYCDLFGKEDPKKKETRENAKLEFARIVGGFIESWDYCTDLKAATEQWRLQKGWSPFDSAHPLDFPKEVRERGDTKGNVAHQYRKLLVNLGLWPISKDENGKPGANALNRERTRSSKRSEAIAEPILTQRAIAAALLAACKSVLRLNKEQAVRGCRLPDAAADHVRRPKWAATWLEKLENAIGAVRNYQKFGEYRYLMMALASRRLSQTQTWIGKREAERQAAALKARKASDDLTKLDPNNEIREWLRSYEGDRAEESDYRIRPGALSGAEAVLQKWQNMEDRKEREDAVAKVLADVDKPGDARLFRDLAAAEWTPQRTPDDAAKLLHNWAQFRRWSLDETRLKIPRFCHPDAFYHPTWCQFGANSQPQVHYMWKTGKAPRDAERGGEVDGERRIWLALPNTVTGKVACCPLHWTSKRLWRDLGKKTDDCRPIPRHDRLSRAHLSRPPDELKPERPFLSGKGTKPWNARLQVDRRDLEALADLWDESKQQWKDGGKASGRLRWFLTFAPYLAQAAGPWKAYAERHNLSANPKTWLYTEENRERGWMSRLDLCRLSDLRVLSVDLGLRHAAACAVWETLDKDAFKKAVDAAGSKNGDVRYGPDGGKPEDAMYCHVVFPERQSKTHGKPVFNKDGSPRMFRPEVVYRRTGPDMWARLKRQFLVKLQGETEEARMATGDEIWRVHRLEQDLGRREPLLDRLVAHGWGKTDKQRTIGSSEAARLAAARCQTKMQIPGHRPSLSVDDLMSSAVDTARLALRRHGDQARISFALTADYKMLRGKKYPFSRQDGDDEAMYRERKQRHVESIRDALFRWYVLGTDRRWDSGDARTLWNASIRALFDNTQCPEPQSLKDRTAFKRKKERWLVLWEELRKPLPESDQEATERKEMDTEAMEEMLLVAAHKLLADVKQRECLNSKWRTRWQDDDKGWQRRLCEISHWLLPGKKDLDAGRRTLADVKRVGGLSLKRLAAIQEFRGKVQVGFFTRLRPDGSKEVLPEHFSDRILTTVKHLKENRVKQLASRIVEAALGIGRELRPLSGRDQKRPRERVYDPCHAIVIEGLKNYRPDELQTRRENRQLMSWSARNVRKFLVEACQLNCVRLTEVPPDYTSRQDSRTGAPGIRCKDWPSGDFRRWFEARQSELDKELRSLQAKDTRNPEDEARAAELQYLFVAYQRTLKGDDHVCIPERGGEIFVSAKPCPSCERKGRKGPPGLQADLNAAANIGLRALLDPDWEGKWWWVPCDPDFKPAKDKVQRCTVLDLTKPLREKPVEEKKAKGKKKEKAKEFVNLWRNVSAKPLHGDEWQVYKEYWNRVRSDVIKVLRKQAGLPDER
jgi:hypothetical protein